MVAPSNAQIFYDNTPGERFSLVSLTPQGVLKVREAALNPSFQQAAASRRKKVTVKTQLKTFTFSD